MNQEQYDHLKQHLEQALENVQIAIGTGALFREDKPYHLFGWAMDAMGISSYERLSEIETSHMLPGMSTKEFLRSPQQRVKVWESIFHLDPIPEERVGSFTKEINDIRAHSDYGDQQKAVKALLALPELQPS